MGEFKDIPNDGNGDDMPYGDYFLSDFDALYLELGMLRGELASLMEELEHINRVVIPRTQTNYLIKVGVLRVELLQLQVGVMKIRRKIALLRASIDRGEVLHEEVLNYRIDKEFKEWDNRLRHEISQIEAAKRRFSSLITSEDLDEVRAVYRQLSRKLNPEINLDLSDEAMVFWPSVHQAYASGDLFHLKALLMMSDDYPDGYDLPSDMGAMRRKRESLNDRLAMTKSKIAAIKEQPVFEWLKLLEDPERLEGEQNRLKDEIGRMRAQHVALLDMQKSLELKGVRR
jgi:predicted  nucleic acid-binding Zn-ribbon protein